ncbi:hypothetical protein [Bradyrhizobium ganzhouense]|uniref:hypothetical protein n=1 Tax=Bradyrhizobium ganzhouense TaxID=1179767 RepID=UPI003CE94EC2
MITRDEARRQILIEWQRSATATPKPIPNGMDGLTFLADLQRYRPDVLEFRDRGDKWQTVHGWLLWAGFLSD